MKDTPHFAKKLEVATNIGIILLVVMIAVVLLRQAKPSRQELHHISIGSQFRLRNIDWQQNSQHLVLALSTTCHFCTESAPFYRRLVDECKRRHIQTIAILPQSTPDSKAYLQNEDVAVDTIVQSQLSELEVSGTPTLLLVDANAVVRGAWFGKLSPSGEQALLAHLP